MMKCFMVAAACGLTVLCASSANAAYTVTFAQVGSDVVASGTGSLNITGLLRPLRDEDTAQIWPGRGWVIIGTGDSDRYSTTTSFTGSFGSGGLIEASSATGGTTGLFGPANILLVPLGYTSGTVFTSTATFANTTLQSLGLNGTSVVTFNSGVNADTFTIVAPSVVAPAVPEPATWAMMLIGFGMVAGAARYRRRSTATTFA